jgi:hypothetical protein
MWRNCFFGDFGIDKFDKQDGLLEERMAVSRWNHCGTLSCLCYTDVSKVRLIPCSSAPRTSRPALRKQGVVEEKKKPFLHYGSADGTRVVNAGIFLELLSERAVCESLNDTCFLTVEG